MKLSYKDWATVDASLKKTSEEISPSLCSIAVGLKKHGWNMYWSYQTNAPRIEVEFVHQPIPGRNNLIGRYLTKTGVVEHPKYLLLEEMDEFYAALEKICSTVSKHSLTIMPLRGYSVRVNVGDEEYPSGHLLYVIRPKEYSTYFRVITQQVQ